MGISTKGYIDSIVPVNMIKLILEKIGAENIRILGTHFENYKILAFSYRLENRSLNVFFDDDALKQETQLDLGFWGYSVEIMTKILEYIPGELMENDYDEKHIKVNRKYELQQEDILRANFLEKTDIDNDLANKIYDFIFDNRYSIKELIEKIELLEKIT